MTPITRFAALGFIALLACACASTRAIEGGIVMILKEKDLTLALDQADAKWGSKDKKRFARGVKQVARLWTKKDGTADQFTKFCKTHFVTGKTLDTLFQRFESKLEMIEGHFNALTIGLRLEMDEDRGALIAADRLFAKYSPSAHVAEDLFKNKLAFVALLNFPVSNLADLLKFGARWSRRQWAEARLSQQFAHRVPASVNQKVAQAYAAADFYIYNYNIYMDSIVDDKGKSLFRKGLKLISHWGLRDELKALYAGKAKNLPLQEVIHTIMKRIISQEIPRAVINNSKLKWNPVTNLVNGKPSPAEPDSRYKTLLEVFKAHRLQDPYYPDMPSHMDRRFKQSREIPEEQFAALLTSVLKAPVSGKVARLIEKRLGRKLRPFDIWYDGFKARGSLDERKLDQIVKAKYPNLEALQKDIPNILLKLGFDNKTADFLANRIEVDPARGAGHAWGPQMRTEKARLRTRVPKGGMNYKGFNIAMHELGHVVEQVFSLYRVDHTLLEGVPNTAFTEGFAFVFQSRDLEVLGLAKPDKKTEALKALDTFWSTREIAGVGLVDMAVWHWMYKNPKATPRALHQAVVKIAKEIWNQYYAPIYGVKDSPILAVYSHMINSGLYLPDYPLGYIIAFQVENYFKKHSLAKDMERMCKLGNLSPNLWMKQAINQKISSRPMLEATLKAVSIVKN